MDEVKYKLSVINFSSNYYHFIQVAMKELVTELEEKVRDLSDQVEEMFKTNRVVGQNLV